MGEEGEQEEQGEGSVPRPDSPDEDSFCGFSNADIPRPIVIKEELVEEDEEEVVVVKVTRAAVPLPQLLIKKEREDEDDIDIFHGFSLDDLPKPIVIKEEVEEEEEEVVASRGEQGALPEYWVQEPAPPLGPVVQGDELEDEFAEAEAEAEPKLSPEKEKGEVKEMVIPLEDEQEEGDIVTEQEVEASPPAAPPSGEEQEVVQELEVVKEIEVTKEQELMEKSGDVVKVQEEAMQVLEQSPQPEVHKVVFSGGEVEVPVGGAGGEVEVEVGQEYQEVQVATTEGYQVQDAMVAEDTSSMPSNAIQIIDQNGQKIVIVNGGGLGTTDESDLDTDAEDREFTVIVEEDEELEEEGVNRDIHIDENNVIEAESIEDILAQFESESAPRSVACPNCRKCFVSAHFLNLHISNHSTMCDLCNTQCCSQVAFID